MAVSTQFAYRSLKGTGIKNAAPTYEALPGFESPQGNIRCCAYSPCGRYFAWAANDRVSIVSADTGDLVSTLPTDNVFELGFSPLGTYVITWQRYIKNPGEDATKNLKVWLVIDEKAISEGVEKDTVGRFVQKNQTGWNLQYTYDEKFCARAVTNEIQLYESHDLTQVWNKLRVEGVTDFAISPGENHSIAVFIPERKGQPAAVRVYNVPNFTMPASQKNFFKGDKVQLKWNDNGTSLIVLAQTEVDKTGKSYYGETNMYILSANGGFDSRIDLDREGTIHDVTWSPKSNSFAVVYGNMPSKTSIFNAKAQVVHSFPLMPRNKVEFSPHGRYVLVGGYGNLNGDTTIYDLEKDFTKVCEFQASNASVCEWSPDGRHILFATTSPRLRVDNGIRIWHATGQLMYTEDINELYHVCWRPQPSSQHPLETNPLSVVPTPHESATTYTAAKKTPMKMGAYRPPGARGQATPLAFKREDEGGAAFVRGDPASFSHHVNGFGKGKPRTVPGAEPAEEHTPLPPGAAPGGGVSLTGTGEGADGEQLSKAAKKNAKKREAKKAAAAAAKDEKVGNALAPESQGQGRRRSGSGSPNQSPSRRPDHNRARSNGYIAPPPGLGPPNGGYKDPARDRSNSRRERGDSAAHTNGLSHRTAPQAQPQERREKQKTPAPAPIKTAPAPPLAPAAPAPEVDVISPTPTTPGGPQGDDKKVRGLLKKIRAIDDLKMRLAGGEKLEDTQMRKISSEDQVRGELAALEQKG